MKPRPKNDLFVLCRNGCCRAAIVGAAISCPPTTKLPPHRRLTASPTSANPDITPIEYTKNTVRKGTVVITGKLSKPRDYFKMLLESMGYKVTNSVSKNTTFLICGDINSTKAKKAKELGVKILTEIDIQENQI